ncbi:OmpA family protein [Proteus myxofaciens]|uniref:Outer membrane protein n=1 Tax=Proteus myxofaciens ATCC 19692 TaxID=1354337 RepID=A0A198FGG2_9GAMM|nr:OmpA family protein [Proteus myxofaciens]OAT23504.1 outer membrane protein [Proteus myxofaciens ATCC 19692]
MQNPIKALVTLFAISLFLWLLWGFWSLGLSISLFFTVFVLVIMGSVLFWRYKQQRQQHTLEQHFIESLPADNYQGAVVLVCGQSSALFSEGQLHRETSQGWYINITSPSELNNVVHTIGENTPSIISQLSLLYALLPEQLTEIENVTQSLLCWRRAIGESYRKLGTRIPFWTTVYISPSKIKNSLESDKDDEHLWFTLLSHQNEFQAELEGNVAEPYSVWLASQNANSKQQLQSALLFDVLLEWLQKVFIPQLTVEQTGALPLTPSAWAIQWTHVEPQPNNLWLQFIEEKTALPLVTTALTQTLLPLPDVMLRRLHHDVNLSRGECLVGTIGLICGLFLIGALSGSYHHNRQLLRHIDDDITRFHRLSDEPLSAKQAAYNQLKDDATQLSRWEREGIPTAYSLALYQGEYVLPYLHTLLGSWAPPSAPEPTIIIQETPTMISLDSLALFDVGQYTLKSGATKVLVDALINIKAKPGWLIIVSGYTDNTGNAEFNQKLSLKRAESVRDWMIETSDINPTCFAVQGYGQSNPVASNDTTEGRARNRRVEIRLMPQADACKTLNDKPVSPMDDGTHTTMKEK